MANENEFSSFTTFDVDTAVVLDWWRNFWGGFHWYQRRTILLAPSSVCSVFAFVVCSFTLLLQFSCLFQFVGFGCSCLSCDFFTFSFSVFVILSWPLFVLARKELFVCVSIFSLCFFHRFFLGEEKETIFS